MAISRHDEKYDKIATLDSHHYCRQYFATFSLATNKLKQINYVEEVIIVINSLTNLKKRHDFFFQKFIFVYFGLILDLTVIQLDNFIKEII